MAPRLRDLVGAITLFALLVGSFWIAHGIGLPTGAGKLLQEAGQ